MVRRGFWLAALGLWSAWAPALIADEANAFVWRGFFNLGVAKTDRHFIYSNQYEERANAQSDSNLGLNVSSRLDDRWSIAAQMIARYNNNNQDVTMDWGFVSWRPTSNITLQFGKKRWPSWMISEYVDVGLQYPWARPPEEVYDLLPVRNFVGASARYEKEVPRVGTVGLEVFTGSYKTNTTGSSLLDLKEAAGAALTIANENLQFRASQLYGRMDITTDALAIQDLKGQFTSFGLKATHSNVLLMGEYARIITKVSKEDEDSAASEVLAAGTAVGTAKASGSTPSAEQIAALQRAGLKSYVVQNGLYGGHSHYVTLGYQWNDLLIHSTYARLYADPNLVTLGDQDSVAAGVKYNLSLTRDIKVEWKRIHFPKDEYGLIDKPAAARDGALVLNMYSFALNIVF